MVTTRFQLLLPNKPMCLKLKKFTTKLAVEVPNSHKRRLKETIDESLKEAKIEKFRNTKLIRT